LKCEKGFYNNFGKCVKICPGELYADNYSLTCKKLEENPVYIKAYTFSRCINTCGYEFKDCSCKESCRKTGNCCSDFRFCEIIGENHIDLELESDNISTEHKTHSNLVNCKFSTTDKKVCLQCMEGFYFYNNECLHNCPIGITAIENNKLCINAGSK
jgi:hypothetical protein